jgi:hypothetical protein
VNAAERISSFGVDLHPDLAAFFEADYREYQGAPLLDTGYLDTLIVDFDGSLSESWEQTLVTMEEQGLDADARESVDRDGVSLTPIAWLFAHAEDDEPETAYLVTHVEAPRAAVFMVDPSSGELEPVADDLRALAARLSEH